MENPIYNWLHYLECDDYEYLYDFIDNAKNNITNEKMIIIVEKEKTKIMSDFKEYFGKKNYYEDVEELYIQARDIVLLDNNINYMTDTELENLTEILSCKESVIGTTNNLNSIHSVILNAAKIIHLTY